MARRRSRSRRSRSARRTQRRRRTSSGRRRRRSRYGRPVGLLPKPTRGALGRFGYGAFDGAGSRRKALVEAVKAYGYRDTVAHLNLIANLTKRSQPRAHRRYRADMAWLHRTYRA